MLVTVETVAVMMRVSQLAVRRWLCVLLFLTSLSLPNTLRSPESVSAAATLDRLIGSGSVTGGKTISLRVELDRPAPTGGAKIAITSAISLIQAPGYVTVPGGSSQVTFSASTRPTYADTSVTVTARYRGVYKSTLVLIKKAVLSSLSLPSAIGSGERLKIVVRLSGRAPASGIVVDVSSNRPSLMPLPGPAPIPAGASSVIVLITAARVGYEVPVNIIARYGGRKIVVATKIQPLHVATPTPMSSATVTASPTATAIASPTVTPTSSPTNSPTAPAGPTSTFTSTPSSTPTSSSTASPTSTATSFPAPTQSSTATASPSATADSLSPQFSFTIRTSALQVGEQTIVDICWLNPLPGPGITDAYTAASGAGGGANIAFTASVGPNVNNPLPVAFSADQPCVTPTFSAIAPGMAWIALEVGPAATHTFYFSPGRIDVHA